MSKFDDLIQQKADALKGKLEGFTMYDDAIKASPLGQPTLRPLTDEERANLPIGEILQHENSLAQQRNQILNYGNSYDRDYSTMALDALKSTRSNLANFVAQGPSGDVPEIFKDVASYLNQGLYSGENVYQELANKEYQANADLFASRVNDPNASFTDKALATGKLAVDALGTAITNPTASLQTTVQSTPEMLIAAFGGGFGLAAATASTAGSAIPDISTKRAKEEGRHGTGALRDYTDAEVMGDNLGAIGAGAVESLSDKLLGSLAKGAAKTILPSGLNVTSPLGKGATAIGTTALAGAGALGAGGLAGASGEAIKIMSSRNALDLNAGDVANIATAAQEEMSGALAPVAASSALPVAATTVDKTIGLVKDKLQKKARETSVKTAAEESKLYTDKTKSDILSTPLDDQDPTKTIQSIIDTVAKTDPEKVKEYHSKLDSTVKSMDSLNKASNIDEAVKAYYDSIETLKSINTDPNDPLSDANLVTRFNAESAIKQAKQAYVAKYPDFGDKFTAYANSLKEKEQAPVETATVDTPSKAFSTVLDITDDNRYEVALTDLTEAKAKVAADKEAQVVVDAVEAKVANTTQGNIDFNSLSLDDNTSTFSKLPLVKKAEEVTSDSETNTSSFKNLDSNSREELTIVADSLKRLVGALDYEVNQNDRVSVSNIKLAAKAIKDRVSKIVQAAKQRTGESDFYLGLQELAQSTLDSVDQLTQSNKLNTASRAKSKGALNTDSYINNALNNIRGVWSRVNATDADSLKIEDITPVALGFKDTTAEKFDSDPWDGIEVSKQELTDLATQLEKTEGQASRDTLSKFVMDKGAVSNALRVKIASEGNKAKIASFNNRTMSAISKLIDLIETNAEATALTPKIKNALAEMKEVVKARQSYIADSNKPKQTVSVSKVKDVKAGKGTSMASKASKAKQKDTTDKDAVTTSNAQKDSTEASIEADIDVLSSKEAFVERTLSELPDTVKEGDVKLTTVSLIEAVHGLISNTRTKVKKMFTALDFDKAVASATKISASNSNSTLTPKILETNKELLENLMITSDTGVKELLPVLSEAIGYSLATIAYIKSPDTLSSIISITGIHNPKTLYKEAVEIMKGILRDDFGKSAIVSLNALQNELASSIFSIVKLDIDKANITPKELDTLQSLVGYIAVQSGIEAGLFKETTVKGDVINALRTAYGESTNNSYGVKAIIIDSSSDKVSTFKKAVKASPNFLYSVLGESSPIKPLRTKPVFQEAEVKIKSDSGLGVNDSFMESRIAAVKALRKAKWTVDPQKERELIDFIDKHDNPSVQYAIETIAKEGAAVGPRNSRQTVDLSNFVNNPAFKQLVTKVAKEGMFKDADITAAAKSLFLPKEVIESIINAVPGLVRSFDNVQSFLQGRAIAQLIRPSIKDTTYYFDYSIGLNGRFNMEGNTINPQHDSLHKQLLTSSADVRFDKLTDNQVQSVKEGLADLIFGLDEKADANTRNGYLNKIDTAIKSVNDVSKASVKRREALKDLLNREDLNAEMLNKFFKSSGIKALTTLPEVTKDNFIGFTYLAATMAKERFTWFTPIGVDGITNGMFVTSMMFVHNTNHLVKVGITSGETLFEAKASLGDAFSDYYNSVVPSNISDTLKKYLSGSALRNIHKNPTTITMYSAGPDTISRGLLINYASAVFAKVVNNVLSIKDPQEQSAALNKMLRELKEANVYTGNLSNPAEATASFASLTLDKFKGPAIQALALESLSKINTLSADIDSDQRAVTTLAQLTNAAYEVVVDKLAGPNASVEKVEAVKADMEKAGAVPKFYNTEKDGGRTRTSFAGNVAKDKVIETISVNSRVNTNPGSSVMAKEVQAIDSAIYAKAIEILQEKGVTPKGIPAHDAVKSNPVDAAVMQEALNQAALEVTLNYNIVEDNLNRLLAVYDYYKEQGVNVNTDLATFFTNTVLKSKDIAAVKALNNPFIHEALKIENEVDIKRVTPNMIGSFFTEVVGKANSINAGHAALKRQGLTSLQYAGALLNPYTLEPTNASSKATIDLAAKGYISSNVFNYRKPNESVVIPVNKAVPASLGNSMYADSMDSVLKKAVKTANTTEVTPESLGSTLDLLAGMDNVSVNTTHSTALQNVLTAVVAPALKTLGNIKLSVSDLSTLKTNIGNSTGLFVNVFKGATNLANQSLQEIFVHETLHSVLANALNTNSKYYEAVKTLVDTVKTHYKNDKNAMANIFMPMVYNNRAEALKLVDYVFYNPKFVGNTNASIHEFMSYALTNEHMIQALKNIPVAYEPKTVSFIPQGNLFASIVNKIYNMISEFFSNNRFDKGSDVYESALNIAKTIANEQVKTATTVEKFFDKIDAAGSNLIDKKLLGSARALLDSPSHKLTPDQKMLVATVLGSIKGVINRGINQANKIAGNKEELSTNPEELTKQYTDLETMQDYRRELFSLMSMDPESSFGKTINRMFSEDSPSVKAIEMLHSKYKSIVERGRMSVKLGVIKGLKEAFYTSMTQEESKSLSKTVLSTDLQNLIAYFGLENSDNGYIEIKNMLDDPKARRAEIAKLKAKYSKLPGAKLVMIQAEGLASYMVEGITDASNQVQNVELLARGSFLKTLRDPSTSKDQKDISANFNNASAKRDLDALITLIGLDILDKNTDNVKTASSVWAREFNNNKEANGFVAVLNQARANIQNAKEFNFKNATVLMQKGYYATEYLKDSEFRIVSMRDVDQLKKEGFSLLEQGIVNDQTTGSKAIMVRQSASTEGRITGLLGSHRLHRDGTSFFEAQLVNDPNLTPAQINAMKQAMAVKETQAMASGKTSKRNYNIPEYNSLGNIVDYRYTLSEAQQELVLGRNYDVINALGSGAAAIHSKKEAERLNYETLNLLKTLYTKSKDKSKNSFELMTEDTEAFQMLPYNLQQKARAMFTVNGKFEGIPVPVGHQTIVMGGEHYTASNSFAIEYLQRKYPDKPIKYWVTYAEQLAMEMARNAKFAIAITNVDVVIGNIISMLVQVAANGIPIQQAMKDMVEGIKFINDYEKYEQKLNYLKGKLAQTPSHLKPKLELEIAELESLLKSNPAKELVDAGVYTSITDDIDLDQYSYFKSYGDWVRDQIPDAVKPVTDNKYVKTVINYAYFSKETPLFSLMVNATKYTDFAARYATVKHLTRENAKLPVDQRMTSNDIYFEAVQAYVNYNLPQGTGLDYLDRMGFTMFTKYFIGIQKVLKNLLLKNPARTVTLIGADAYANISDITDASIIVKNMENLFSNPVNNAVEAITPAIWRVFN